MLHSNALVNRFYKGVNSTVDEPLIIGGGMRWQPLTVLKGNQLARRGYADLPRANVNDCRDFLTIGLRDRQIHPGIGCWATLSPSR